MSDYWTESAAKLQAELAARGVKPDATDDVIVANASDWFAGLSENTKASVIATMRNQVPH
jgi:hypothetical protein